MTAVLLTPPVLKFFANDGVTPLANGKVYTYSAGTDTPKATYTTAAGDVSAANPVVLDSLGQTTMWISGSYKFVVKDSNGSTISTTDNVTAFTALAASSTAYFQSFSGDGSTTVFTTSTDLGTDEKAIYVWVDAGGGKGYDLKNPSAYTIAGTALTIPGPPASGTNNIYVSAPSSLIGAASSAAADAAASAAESAASAAAALISQNAAAVSAATAASYAASLSSTSTTSLLIATGAKTFTTQANKQYSAGQFLIASSAANNANYMHGTVTSYSGTTLIMNITDIGGVGTLADWSISLSGTRGTTGATGAPGASGAIVLLQSQTASNSATIDFTSTYITSTYKQYIVEIINVAPGTDGAVLSMQMSQGGVFNSGSSYRYTTNNTKDTTVAGVSGVGATSIALHNLGQGSAANENLNGSLVLYDPTLGTLYKKATWNLCGEYSSDDLEILIHGTGAFTANTTACDGVRFLFGSGNIASGTFKLYGVT